jgi:hypothetical protein
MDMGDQQGFLFQFCEVGGLAIHPQEEWAKFGYRSDSKGDFFIESWLVLVTNRNSLSM